jgi:TPR repeat protein
LRGNISWRLCARKEKIVNHTGRGLERDEKKANRYYELAAMGGNAVARCNLGNSEFRAGNWDRALKHYMIAAGGDSTILSR